jgi:hypothetical protein
LGVCLISLAVACGGSTTPATATTSGDEAPAPVVGRFARRVTADQLERSLETATGQRWPAFEQRADTLGRPDYLQTLTEGEQLSVAFLRFAEDGARATCQAAVNAERDLTDPAQRPILGNVDLQAPDPAVRHANLRRLVLRFLGHVATGDDDPIVAAFAPLLDSPIAGRQGRAPMEALRWYAVCVALATNLDFVTY